GHFFFDRFFVGEQIHLLLTAEQRLAEEGAALVLVFFRRGLGLLLRRLDGRDLGLGGLLFCLGHLFQFGSRDRIRAEFAQIVVIEFDVFEGFVEVFGGEFFFAQIAEFGVALAEARFDTGLRRFGF